MGKAKKELKTRLNLILDIDNENVILDHFTYNNIDSNEMKIFFNNLIKKLGDNRTKYLVIIDNAAYHVTIEIKSFLVENKMKIVTNSPYYSHFNLIEYEFFNIKIHLYKELLKDCKELEERIKNVIKSEDNKNTKKNIC